MGVAALNFFTGLTKLEDKRTSMAGYIFSTDYGPVIPVWHPSHLLKGKMHYSEAWKLYLARAVQVAERGVVRLPLNYALYPTIAQAWAFYEEYKAAGFPPLSVDMETPYSSQKDEEDRDNADEDLEAQAAGIDVMDPSYTILRTSYSFKPGHAITWPHVYPFTEVDRALLASPGVKIVWNGLAYDIPRFELAGFTVNGPIWDGMLFFGKLKPGLPKKLAAVAPLFTDLPEWKSQSKEQPEYYAGMDSDGAGRCTVKIVEALKAKGMWEVAERHITQLFAALRRASKRGINVDRPARKAAREDFEQRVIDGEAALQQHVPLECRKTKVYNSRPSVFERAAAKKGWDLTDGSWVKVQVEVELKPGWVVGEDGEEYKPKPPKKVRVKKEKKPRAPKKPSRKGKSSQEPDTAQTSLEGMEPTPEPSSSDSHRAPS